MSITNLELLEDSVQIILNSSKTRFHFTWLYDNCLCTSCKQSSSGQKRFKAIKFSFPKILIRISNNMNLYVEFEPNHFCTFSNQFLQQNRYDNEAIDRERMILNVNLKENHTKPIYFDFEAVFMKSKKETLKWMDSLLKNGVVVIKSTPRNEEILFKFIEGTGCESSHRLYGNSFIVEATENPINVAYSSEALELHQDLAYYESPPGIQLLHCLEFDSSIIGGESTFFDGHLAAEILRKEDPQSFKVLTTLPATFQKDHVHRDDPAKMFYQRPHIQTNHFGEVTSIFWAPPFEGPLKIPPQYVEDYYKAYDKFSQLLNSRRLWDICGMKFRLNPGDLVIFNNRRFLHGRASFEVPIGSKGKRKLHGCYLEMDRFLNRYRVMNWEVFGCENAMIPGRPGTSSFL